MILFDLDLEANSLAIRSLTRQPAKREGFGLRLMNVKILWRESLSRGEERGATGVGHKLGEVSWGFDGNLSAQEASNGMEKSMWMGHD